MDRPVQRLTSRATEFLLLCLVSLICGMHIVEATCHPCQDDGNCIDYIHYVNASPCMVFKSQNEQELCQETINITVSNCIANLVKTAKETLTNDPEGYNQSVGVGFPACQAICPLPSYSKFGALETTCLQLAAIGRATSQLAAEIAAESSTALPTVTVDGATPSPSTVALIVTPVLPPTTSCPESLLHDNLPPGSSMTKQQSTAICQIVSDAEDSPYNCSILKVANSKYHSNFNSINPFDNDSGEYWNCKTNVVGWAEPCRYLGLLKSATKLCDKSCRSFESFLKFTQIYEDVDKFLHTILNTTASLVSGNGGCCSWRGAMENASYLLDHPSIAARLLNSLQTKGHAEQNCMRRCDYLHQMSQFECPLEMKLACARLASVHLSLGATLPTDPPPSSEPNPEPEKPLTDPTDPSPEPGMVAVSETVMSTDPSTTPTNTAASVGNCTSDIKMCNITTMPTNTTASVGSVTIGANITSTPTTVPEGTGTVPEGTGTVPEGTGTVPEGTGTEEVDSTGNGSGSYIGPFLLILAVLCIGLVLYMYGGKITPYLFGPKYLIVPSDDREAALPSTLVHTLQKAD